LAKEPELVGALLSGVAAAAVAPSEGSDVVARFATLEPLPEQDAGVPVVVAAQAAEELPQFHKRGAAELPQGEVSPDSVCGEPP
jgi:hypothetical protein